jgi:hypothetical protein
MKKLVLLALAAMLCLVSQCWACPIYEINVNEACPPETEQQEPQTDSFIDNTADLIILANNPMLNQMVANVLGFGRALGRPEDDFL